MTSKSDFLMITKLPSDTSGKDRYEVWNTQQRTNIGIIAQQRVGRFIHWCFYPQLETYFTNGCLKEISKFITKLYAKAVLNERKDI